MPPRASRALVRPTLALMLLLSAACSTRVAPPEPPISVRRGDQAFRREDYDTAIAEYRTYLDSEEQGVHTPRAIYKSALASYRLGHYGAAVATLDEMTQRYPEAHWVQTEALRGDSLRELGRPVPALTAYDTAWSVASEADRPKLKLRIEAALAVMDRAQLIEAADAVDDEEVREMVASAMAQPRPQAVVAAATAPPGAGANTAFAGRPAAAAPAVPPPAAQDREDSLWAEPPPPPAAQLQVREDPDLQPRNTLVGAFQRLGRDDGESPQVVASAVP
ncbi:MAG TPA: tetratricopeptide repeat protein, partial [Terriglobales bacterium]|nr:tetratricopeptide repeat protein [Terriglobales bacterium]